jgi:hypothetical protein
VASEIRIGEALENCLVEFEGAGELVEELVDAIHE